MDIDMAYKMHPDQQAQYDQDMARYNKYIFMDEVRSMSSIKNNISEELVLVAQYIFRFQECEEEIKHLLWLLYCIAINPSSDIYLSKKKIDEVTKMPAGKLVAELEQFGYRGGQEKLRSVSVKFKLLTKTRNDLIHHLFLDESRLSYPEKAKDKVSLKDKDALKSRLKKELKKLDTLLIELGSLTAPLGLRAATIEVQSKLK